MALTREDIQKMPVRRLRQLDISDPDDEKLVQALILEKMAEQPIVGSPARAKPHATDNLTPEGEAELQKVIDSQNASRKAAALGVEAPVETEDIVPLSHPADSESEVDIEVRLAQLEAEKAALTAAEETPFVPEIAEEPVVEEEAEAEKTPKASGNRGRKTRK